MNKLLAITILLMAFVSTASAQVEFEEVKSRTQEKLQVTGFFDYYPFGQYENNAYEGVFEPFIEEFVEQGKYMLDYLPISMSYEDTVREVSKGEADVLLGMYAETSLYKDMKFIYPAAIDNPINLVMLPSRIGEIHSVDDLKKMKGAIHTKERLSDYIKDKMTDYHLEYVDNSYDLYGKLIRGEIDYIFTSIYFGKIEVSKLGVGSLVVFSKQSIWNMPMFIGISKASVHREFLSHVLSKMLGKPETLEKIQNNMLNIIKQIEEENYGIVPPSYTTP